MVSGISTGLVAIMQGGEQDNTEQNTAIKVPLKSADIVIKPPDPPVLENKQAKWTQLEETECVLRYLVHSWPVGE